MRNRPYGFEIYLVNIKTIRTIAHIFVAFSEKLNFSNKSVSFFFSSIQTCHQRPRAPLAIIRSSQPLHLSVKLLRYPKKSLLQSQVYLGYPVSRTSRAFLTSKGRAWRQQAVSVRVLDWAFEGLYPNCLPLKRSLALKGEQQIIYFTKAIKE